MTTQHNVNTSVIIGSLEYRAWEDLEITLALDAPSTASFSSPFEPDRSEFRATFRPFSFKPLRIEVNGEPLFTGTMVDISPSVSSSSRAVSVSGYSTIGVLQDCTPPKSAFPIEFNGLKIGQIAAKLCEPFQIAIASESDEGAVFERVALEPDQKVYAFLTDLAQQRGLILSSTPEGALRIYRPAVGSTPVARLIEGEAPLMGVSPSFSPQSYFSEITGISRTKAGRIGASHTQKNTHLPNVLRPSITVLDDTDAADLTTAVEGRMGRMFGNLVSYNVELPTWFDPSGRLWTPGTTISLLAPGAMIYSATDVIIRNVSLRQNAGSVSASLTCVLPGSFSGQMPSSLPWD